MKKPEEAFPPNTFNDMMSSSEIEGMDILLSVDEVYNNDRNDLEIMLINQIERNELPAHLIPAHIRVVVDSLQSEVSMDINNIRFYLEDTKMLKNGLDIKEKTLNEELEIVKNDAKKYEGYINSQDYCDFKNETWESLMNLGRDELQKRNKKLCKMRHDLWAQNQVLQKRMRVCHNLLWTLYNEQMRRQQRLQLLSFSSQSLSNIVTLEMKRLQDIRSTFDIIFNPGILPMCPQENNQTNILNQQKFGCTFDFLLRHRVNKGGSLKKYSEVVHIFEKKLPSFETVENSSRTKKVPENIFKKQLSRLERENYIYMLSNLPSVSNSQKKPVDVSYSRNVSKITSGVSQYNLSVNSQQPPIIYHMPSHLQHEWQNQFLYERENILNGYIPKDSKTTILSKSEKHERQTEGSDANPNKEQTRDAKQHEIRSDEMEKKRTNLKNDKIRRKKGNCSNRYGLRSQLERDIDLKFELNANAKTNEISCDIDSGLKSEAESHIHTKTTESLKNNDQNDDTVLNEKKNLTEKNENKLKKSEGREVLRSVINSLPKNKTEVKNLRNYSLEKLFEETKLTLSSIVEGTQALQGFSKKIGILMNKNKDSEVNVCNFLSKSEEGQNIEQKKTELIKYLDILHTFLKRNDKCKELVEGRELLLLNLNKNFLIEALEELILKAANDIHVLDILELKVMETKVIRQDVSKVIGPDIGMRSKIEEKQRSPSKHRFKTNSNEV